MKIIYLSKIKKILVYGYKNIIFETDKALNPNLADDQLILGCYYNPRFYEFVTICLKKIKIWNAFNGKVSFGAQASNSITEKVYMQWNDTDLSLDFIFP